MLTLPPQFRRESAMYEDLGYPCVLALASVCQTIVGEMLAVPVMIDLGSLPDRLSSVPPPALYTEAVMAAALLLQFTCELGTLIHRRMHAGDPTVRCDFDPELYVPKVAIPRSRPSAWRASDAIAVWIRRFSNGLGARHNVLAERTRVRLIDRSRQRAPIQALAGDAGASASVVYRRFVATVGDPPVRYRTRIRVADAIPLIRQGWPIAAVAKTVGWSERKDLYRALRSVLEMSPTEVRSLTDAGASALIRQLTGTSGPVVGMRQPTLMAD
jgi:AraC-like DNA-binding protein